MAEEDKKQEKTVETEVQQKEQALASAKNDPNANETKQKVEVSDQKAKEAAKKEQKPAEKEPKEEIVKKPLRFIHLRIHTDFSLINGLQHVEAYVKHAVNNYWPALAISDYMNVCGLVRLYEQAARGFDKEKSPGNIGGVKPIAAVDLNLHDPISDTASRITCYAMSEKGYHNICELMSRAYSRGYIKVSNCKEALPCVEFSWFEERNSHNLGFLNEDLIVLSGAREGAIGQALIKNYHEDLKRYVEFFKKNFPDRFYIELVRTNRENEELYIHKAVKLAREQDLPIVATNDVMFMNKDDFEIHEMRVAIQQKYTMSDPARPKIYSKEQYLKSAEEMCELFKDLPEALVNTVEIAKRCNVYIPLGTPMLPKFPVPKEFVPTPEHLTRVQRIWNDKEKEDKAKAEENGEIYEKPILSEEEIQAKKKLASYLIWMAETGLEQRLEILYPDPEIRKERRPIYDERLAMELDVIIHMGFPGYFLIVMEFIQWSKANGIPIGPGRGSGAGSLVAYSIKITDLDPLPFSLLFERFLNPERVSMPDFDVDMCQDRRGEIIKHVSDTYGHEAVSQIITFGSMAAKAAIKDVTRVLSLSYTFGDQLAKLIPNTPGMTLAKAFDPEKNPDTAQKLKDRYNKEEDVRRVIDIARRLEGVTKSTGKHAGGVVISPTTIVDFAPLRCEEDGSEPVTQYDKHDIENAGLIKFDFLGLKTLTIIQNGLNMINEKNKKLGLPLVDISNIPLDDKDSFQMLLDCHTTGVFQLESQGMRNLIAKLKPDVFEDMIALVALFRPGPLDSGMVDNFINRKHGVEEVAYPMPEYQHECLKPALEPTYGVVVYQEQVMQIAQALAGYTLGGADLLRRAMGKKEPEIMAHHRKIFVEGAQQKGNDPELAGKIYDIVEKFAGYGFNKSHSAAYALVAYQTLWLKTHYPAEFIAALMTGDCDKKEKIVAYVAELRRLGVKIEPPDVNYCKYEFTVNDEGSVVYGMCAVSGVGSYPIQEIVKARADGPFIDLFDFCSRVDLSKINKKLLETLIWIGALDKLGPHRAALLDALEDAMDYAMQRRKDLLSGQYDLFADSEEGDMFKPKFRDVPILPDSVWLEKEKSYLGLYLTGHPVDQYKDELSHYNHIPIASVVPNDYRDRNAETTIIGWVIDAKVFTTKSGKRMGVMKLDDRSSQIEALAFGETVDQYEHLIRTDQLLMVRGVAKPDYRTQVINISVNEICNITQARIDYAKFVLVKIKEDRLDDEVMENIMNVIEKHRSNDFSLKICYYSEKCCIMMNTPKALCILPTDEFLDDLRMVIGKDNVSIQF